MSVLASNYSKIFDITANINDLLKALEIDQQYIIGKTAEPKFKYHLEETYKSNNMVQKIAPIKDELLKSTFELGPNVERKGISL